MNRKAFIGPVLVLLMATQGYSQASRFLSPTNPTAYSVIPHSKLTPTGAKALENFEDAITRSGRLPDGRTIIPADGARYKSLLTLERDGRNGVVEGISIADAGGVQLKEFSIPTAFTSPIKTEIKDIEGFVIFKRGFQTPSGEIEVSNRFYVKKIDGKAYRVTQQQAVTTPTHKIFVQAEDIAGTPVDETGIRVSLVSEKGVKVGERNLPPGSRFNVLIPFEKNRGTVLDMSANTDGTRLTVRYSDGNEVEYALTLTPEPSAYPWTVTTDKYEMRAEQRSVQPISRDMMKQLKAKLREIPGRKIQEAGERVRGLEVTPSESGTAAR